MTLITVLVVLFILTWICALLKVKILATVCFIIFVLWALYTCISWIAVLMVRYIDHKTQKCIQKIRSWFKDINDLQVARIRLEYSEDYDENDLVVAIAKWTEMDFRDYLVDEIKRLKRLRKSKSFFELVGKYWPKKMAS